MNTKHDRYPVADRKLHKSIGQAIRRRRLALNLSQEELAALADLHRTYIVDIELGYRNVSLTTILKIAKAIQYEPSKLMQHVEKWMVEN